MCARWRQFELMPPEMGSSLSEARMVASCRQWRHPLASSRVLLCSHILSQQALFSEVGQDLAYANERVIHRTACPTAFTM